MGFFEHIKSYEQELQNDQCLVKVGGFVELFDCSCSIESLSFCRLSINFEMFSLANLLPSSVSCLFERIIIV